MALQPAGWRSAALSPLAPCRCRSHQGAKRRLVCPRPCRRAARLDACARFDQTVDAARAALLQPEQPLPPWSFPFRWVVCVGDGIVAILAHHVGRAGFGKWILPLWL